MIEFFPQDLELFRLLYDGEELVFPFRSRFYKDYTTLSNSFQSPRDNLFCFLWRLCRNLSELRDMKELKRPRTKRSRAIYRASIWKLERALVVFHKFYTFFYFPSNCIFWRVFIKASEIVVWKFDLFFKYFIRVLQSICNNSHRYIWIEKTMIQANYFYICSKTKLTSFRDDVEIMEIFI